MTFVLSFIFVLGVLIFFHELGHFLVAKWSGIKVEKFSLGFPPFIFKKRKGETEYCIGVIPLGGFVKMAGENPDEEASGEPYEFMSKPVSVRAAVILAGPVANFILAWVILWGLFFVKGQMVVDDDQAIVGIVSEDSPAAQTGLQEGDIITAVNGYEITSVAADQTFADGRTAPRDMTAFEVMATLISEKIEEEITLQWQRDGQIMSAAATTMADEVYNAESEKVAVGKIGVGQQVGYERMGFFSALGKGLSESVRFVTMVGGFVVDLITQKVSPKMIGGPVFIAQMAGQTAQAGFSSLLVFMALLSVNLAVLNILPIPVLDGGHLVFLGIEAIKGSPLSINQRMIAQQIGLVFLLVVIVLVTYNDIMRFISG